MLARKIAYNAIISAISRILATGLALVIIGLITRYLGQNGFGNYSTILAFLYIFSILADLGLYSIAVREISKDGAPESEIASQAFSLRFWAGFLIFGLAPVISLVFPYSFETRIGIALGAIGFWFLSNTQVLMAVFQKYLKMERVAIADLVGRFVQLSFLSLVIWRGWGLLSIVLTFSASGLANFLLVWLFAQRYIPVRLTWNFAYWKRMLSQSYPLAISAIFVMIYFKLDTVMLSVMKPASDVGIYGVAYKILESLIFFPAMLVGLVMPLLSRYALTQLVQFQKVSQKTLDILLIFAFPLAAGGIILSKPIIRLIAGQEFLAAAGVLNILIVATAIIFLGALFSNMLIALERQRSLAKIYGVGAIVNFSANLILIPRFSYWGAAGSTLLTEFLVTLLMVVVIFKATKFLPNFSLCFKALFASALMATALYFLKDFNLFVLILLAGLIYFMAIFALRALRLSEVISLIRPGSRNLTGFQISSQA